MGRAVGKQFEKDDFVRVADVADADFVLNMFDAEDPKAFRRASRGTYSAAFYELPETPEDALRASIRCSSGRSRTSCCSAFRARASGSRRWSRDVPRPGRPGGDLRALEPLATSRLVIDNEWIPDLEPELWDGDEVTADIGEAGRRLDELDLLPSPFPVEEYLSGRDLRHVMRLYGSAGSPTATSPHARMRPASG